VTNRPFSRVLLVGFMGAGKTSVGRAVANGLRWRFEDFDDVIEAELGLPITEIFAQQGEPRFREVEERVAQRLLSQDEVVLGSGGGWAARRGRLGSVPEGTETVWLQVSAKEAVRRTSGQSGRRPLLAGDDVLDEARSLLEKRAPFYAAARWRVDTEGSTVEDVSALILGMLIGNDIENDAE
jgi:shikimate kinase